MEAEPPRKPSIDGSVVDDLVRRTRRFLGEISDDYIKRPIDGLLRWILGRAVSYLVAAGLLIAAAVFLMIGATHGLIQAKIPVWIAYLSLGGVALVASVIVLRCGRPPDKGRS